MPHRLSWYIEGRVVCAECMGDMTLQDLQQVDHMIVTDYLDQKPDDAPALHLLIDLTSVGRVPLTVHELSMAFTHLRHPALGWSIIVSENRFIGFLGGVISQIARARFRSFKSFDKAVEFLTTVDATLAELQPSET